MTDWRLTWAGRVVAMHSEVMRDQKFGNAPTGAANSNSRPLSAEEIRRAIAFAEDNQDLERAAEYRERLASLTAKPPPQIARLISGATANLRATQ